MNRVSRRFESGLNSVVRGVGTLLFSTPCVICEDEIGPICSPCRDELIDAAARQCPRCALNVGPFGEIKDGCSQCRGRSLGFDSAVALGPYQGPVRELCLRLKSPNGAWLTRRLVDVLMDSRGLAIREKRADLIVPIPLHWQRRLMRGYNQAGAIAAELSNCTGVPLLSALRRVRRTPKLHDRNKTERADLLKKAFAARAPGKLKDKSVLLVDDILTTGSTCGAAARALKAAGARTVTAVVLGRAEVGR